MRDVADRRSFAVTWDEYKNGVSLSEIIAHAREIWPGIELKEIIVHPSSFVSPTDDLIHQQVVIEPDSTYWSREGQLTLGDILEEVCSGDVSPVWHPRT